MPVSSKLNFSDLKNMVKSKWSLKHIKTLRLFNSDGVEMFEEDLTFLKDKTTLYVSQGEDFDSASLFSEYKKVRVLGKGGFGQVVLGEHRGTKEKVAIKYINTAQFGNANDIDMVFKESDTLKALRHKNIVMIKNCYTLTNMQVVFIMEYLEGGDLYEFIIQRGRISEEESRDIFRQICDAMSYCHKENLIHRDLKLENIMFQRKDQKLIKIVDFGIAGLSNHFDLEKIGVGSLKYMAPEVLSGKVNKIEASIDIWALGVILYAMVCGELPFEGVTQKQVIGKILAGSYGYSSDLINTLSP